MTTNARDNADSAKFGPVAGDDTQHGPPTVSCPKGHANAWNYKFCGVCGSPIGVIPWPSSESEPTRTRQPKSRRGLLTVAAILLVAVVAATTVTFVMSRSSRQGEGDSTPAAGGTAASANAGTVTCSDSPTLEAESIDLTPDGLTVSTAFMTPCSGGDVESNPSLVVTVADGRRDIAAGSFDFSLNPLQIEPGIPSRRTLVFPPGMYWRTPDMFSSQPAVVAHRTETSERSASPAASNPSTLVASEPAKPAYGSVDDVAEAVLDELRDSDLPVVRESIANRWVPQVSSKRVGLVVEGRTLTSADILRDHLAYRDRFTGARLVWSGQWSTFSAPDFWVTVVGPPLPTPESANTWCDSNGYGVDDCFAKFVSNLFGVEGTTMYRK